MVVDKDGKRKWAVYIRRDVYKKLRKMPRREQVAIANLIEDLAEKGPIRKEWPNFSALAGDEYHCHLSRSWVACWKVKEKDLEIEVYYAGSRENAPY